MATEAHGININIFGQTISGKMGLQITTTNAIGLDSITLEPNSTDQPTVVYLLDSSKAVLASAAVVSLTGTFSSPIQLDDATVYFVAADQLGESYDAWETNVGPGYPVLGTNLNWTGALNWNGDVRADINGWVWVVESVETSAAAVPTKMDINVDDTFKEVSAVKVNVNDAWKEIASAKINIGDSWKTIY